MAAKTDKYMRIERDFFDALCRADLNGAETMVLFYILRRSLPEGVKSDKSTSVLSLILAEQISQGTGLQKSYVRKCVASLAKKKIVVSEKAKDALADKRDVSCFSGERLYGINFRTETWVF